LRQAEPQRFDPFMLLMDFTRWQPPTPQEVIDILVPMNAAAAVMSLRLSIALRL
jgi:hypothetical protein